MPRKMPRTAKSLPAEVPTILQFMITLLETHPPIWRRIQFSDDDTLANLHTHIQGAFGWEDCHMHAFEIEKSQYINLEQDPFGQLEDAEDESLIVISKLLPENPRKKCRWIYEYDFGDSWRHEVLFEKRVPAEQKVKYPRCVDGARACPFEDSGGPYGYADLLYALENPEESGRSEMLEVFGRFDPTRFDSKKATREMQKWYKVIL